MKTRFLLCLFVSITLSAATPPTAPPRPEGKAGKRVVQIETDFGLVFTGAMKVANKEGKETPYWTFGRKVTGAPFDIIVIGVPILATDKQIVDAFACSVIYAKFCQEEAKSHAAPSPTPAAFEIRTVYSRSYDH